MDLHRRSGDLGVCGSCHNMYHLGCLLDEGSCVFYDCPKGSLIASPDSIRMESVVSPKRIYQHQSILTLDKLIASYNDKDKQEPVSIRIHDVTKLLLYKGVHPKAVDLCKRHLVDYADFQASLRRDDLATPLAIDLGVGGAGAFFLWHDLIRRVSDIPTAILCYHLLPAALCFTLLYSVYARSNRRSRSMIAYNGARLLEFEARSEKNKIELERILIR